MFRGSNPAVNGDHTGADLDGSAGQVFRTLDGLFFCFRFDLIMVRLTAEMETFGDVVQCFLSDLFDFD